MVRLPRLPSLLDRKIYKTGQTRGADDDVIYQNRVGRNSTVLIPYHFWSDEFTCPEGEDTFENGFMVLIQPEVYFGSHNATEELACKGLFIGNNCIVFYETRYEWERYNPDSLGWEPANSRINPLGGQYVARVPATTAMEGGDKVNRGFTTSRNKGAGIRLYEYASLSTMTQCRMQLEALYWLCQDSLAVVVQNGMSLETARYRRSYVLDECHQLGLLDYERLLMARMINSNNQTICPLCIEPLSGTGFFSRLVQAEGREVPDLTVTEINLFHIEELRYGVYNHRPYNLGWGHHHCNVVTKDSGITSTLKWMETILNRNRQAGFEV